MTKNPEQAFVDFLEKENLQNKKLLLMISGGVDSMVLFFIALKFCNPKYIHVFHLDHGFRETSVLDAQFVGKECENKGIKYTIKTLSKIPEKNKESLWRKERQKLSKECAETKSCERILTAHHATDLIETMIFRITKGCGVQGLSPFQIGTKPFLNVSKEELLEYAKEHNIPWNEDASNQDITFERNRIRKEVLPVLRSINPSLEKVFVREQELFGELQEFIDLEVKKIIDLKHIPREKFIELPSFLQQAVLHELGGSSCNEVQDCLRWIRESQQGGTQKKLSSSILKLQKNILSWKKL